jgi:hypothetical protein
LEYLIIIGFFLLLVSLLTDYYDRTSSERAATVIAEASLDGFKLLSDSVFALGVPAEKTVKVSLPDRINASRTGIGYRVVQISFYSQSDELVDVARFFDYNVTGSFPNQTGNYELTVKSLGAAGVEVSFT